MKAQRYFPLVVIAAGVLAYHNSFTGGFFHDDVMSIPENPTIRRLWPIWQPLSPPHQVSETSGLTVEGRPLLNLSLAINYALGGYNVWGYHAVNLAIHILAGLTLMGIVRRTLLQPAPILSGPMLRERFGSVAGELALAIAVLWMMHPLHTESVTYIVQRAESLTGLLYLLTLYCFIRGSRASGALALQRLWYGLSVTTCALGMACKEVMITAPVMVLLYDCAFLSGSLRDAWRRRCPLYLALAGTWIVLGLVLAAGGNLATASRNARHIGITRWEYLATQPGVILYYLRLCVWPSHLRLLHGWPIARTWSSIAPPTIVVMILLGAIVWAWRTGTFWAAPASFGTRRAWGFVGAWFFLILAPSSSIVPALDALSEHRLYLPLVAVACVVVIGLYVLAGRRSLVVVIVMSVGLGFLTWQRNQDYRMNPEYNLALALQRAGRIPEAIAHYELAVRSTPDDEWLHYNFAVALTALGRSQEAMEHYEQALRIDPDFAQAHNNLAIALEEVGRVPEAIDHWEHALRVKPDYAEAHSNLGVALGKSGRTQEAIDHFQEALRAKPDDAGAHYNLANALQQTGKLADAVAHYEQALRINPGFADAHYNYGVALVRLGRVQEAIGHYEQALRINPNLTKAQEALRRLGAVR